MKAPCYHLKHPTFRVAEWIFNLLDSMTMKEIEKLTVKFGGKGNIDNLLKQIIS